MFEPSYRERFTEGLEDTFDACMNLMRRKNSDYTKLNTEDPFHNFRQEAMDLFIAANRIHVDGITLGLLTRLNDKRRRRENLILTKEQLVLDESLEDTILDEINYLAILLVHYKMHGRKQEAPSEVSDPFEINPELVAAREMVQHLAAELQRQKETVAAFKVTLDKKNDKKKAAKA